ISAGGAVARVPASDIPLQGRRTTGKRFVKVAQGDRVVEVTRAAGEGPAPSGGGGAEGTAPQGPSDIPEEGPEQDAEGTVRDGDGEDQLTLLGDV
ncbi:MAG TPA: DNA gyrase C-terminal beta-propeller domain-containing protein, partial [Longimicrobiales bacterium]|nr:DNA gyrase C-terminal beta-propeller domain-containing protein [Longimicrobiales bacterium]